MNETYQCICGKSFENQHKLKLHQNLCKLVFINKHGIDKWNEKQQKCINARNNGYKKYVNQLHEDIITDNNKKLNKWIEEQHKCENCQQIMTVWYGSGRFCSQKCAKAFTTKSNRKEVNQKISNSIQKYKNSSKFINNQLKQRQINEEHYLKSPKRCIICNKILSYDLRYRLTCSTECLNERWRQSGLVIANKEYKRSKNEIEFCNKCEEYFGKENIIHNEPIFNGWDADIIILKYKLAILWNGPWHYRIVTKTHKLKEVQNRDNIKLKEIKKCNYIPYIIKDLSGKYNPIKIDKEFNLLLSYLNLL